MKKLIIALLFIALVACQKEEFIELPGNGNPGGGGGSGPIGNPGGQVIYKVCSKYELQHITSGGDHYMCRQCHTTVSTPPTSTSWDSEECITIH